MGRRVILARLRETNNRGVIAVGVVQFEEADETKDYTANITIRENGADLGSKSITLSAGSDENEDSTANDAIDIRKQPLPRGGVEIVARYRVFNVSGGPADNYEISATLAEGGANVVRGRASVQLQ